MSQRAKRFLTTEEVAAAMNAPLRTVQHWCATGALPCVRTPGGREWRIPIDVLRDRADLAGYATNREAELEGY